MDFIQMLDRQVWESDNKTMQIVFIELQVTETINA